MMNGEQRLHARNLLVGEECARPEGDTRDYDLRGGAIVRRARAPRGIDARFELPSHDSPGLTAEGAREEEEVVGAGRRRRPTKVRAGGGDQSFSPSRLRPGCVIMNARSRSLSTGERRVQIRFEIDVEPCTCGLHRLPSQDHRCNSQRRVRSARRLFFDLRNRDATPRILTKMVVSLRANI